jgi:hypothetical protein
MKPTADLPRYADRFGALDHEARLASLAPVVGAPH